jgi:hypothetical protein
VVFVPKLAINAAVAVLPLTALCALLAVVFAPKLAITAAVAVLADGTYILAICKYAFVSLCLK